MILGRIMSNSTEIVTLRDKRTSLGLRSVPSRDFDVVRTSGGLSARRRISALSCCLVRGCSAPTLRSVGMHRTLGCTAGGRDVMGSLLSNCNGPTANLVSPAIPCMARRGDGNCPCSPSGTGRLLGRTKCRSASKSNVMRGSKRPLDLELMFRARRCTS